MPNSNEPRLILAVPARGWGSESEWVLREAYKSRNVAVVEEQLKQRLVKLSEPATEFRVVAFPSNASIPAGLEITEDEFHQFLVFGIVVTGGPEAARELAVNVRQAFGDDASVGADLAVSATQNVGRYWSHWCAEEADYGLVGDRGMALRTIRAERALLSREGLPGPETVNIVFVDTGLPPDLLPEGGFRGWPVLEDPLDPHSQVRKPGQPLTGHGEMVARNARAVVRASGSDVHLQLLDCPVIPDGITDLPVFLHSVTAALFSVWAVIAWKRAREEKPARTGWVICNAWGVFDPSLEPPEAPYSNNREHPVAVTLRLLEGLCADIVFAAGNCGQFCPNARCHPDFTGPGASINGANALEEVLTVGAVRTDRLWLGYSGQGPGIAHMAQEKPDLCAPSQFANEDDAGPNTGTSTACGLTAGAVALLRTKWRCSDKDPAVFRAILREQAAQPDGPVGWRDRTGYGILDLAAAASRLNAP
jgi:Subtilase family